MFQMLLVHFTELARIFWMVARSLFRGCSRAKSWSLDMPQTSSMHMISLNHKLLPFIAKELIFTQMLVKQKAEEHPRPDHFQSV